MSIALKQLNMDCGLANMGLPFIGSGDWNDGMDKVGNHGKGESVWLAFFLYDILISFIETSHVKNDKAFEETCRVSAAHA